MKLQVMKSKYRIIIVAFLLNARAIAQSSDKLTRENYAATPNYRIGEMLPDFGASKIINSNDSTIRLSALSDRLLIIDFWATTCGTCVEALPKMAALQKEFGNQITVMPVTEQPEPYIRKFLEQNRHTKGIQIASIVDDKAISNYFPKKFIPHEVWIYKGKIIGITSFEYIDEYNIQQVLSGHTPDWPMKNDFYQLDANSKPLFSNDPHIDSNHYAKITGYIEVKSASAAGADGSLINEGLVRDSLHKRVRVYFINQSIRNAYMGLWTKLIDWNSLLKPVESALNVTDWKVKDKSKYNYEFNDIKNYGYLGDWMRKHAISFELVQPDIGQTDKQIYRAAIAGLDSLLNLQVRWEMRKEKVWILYRTAKEDKFLKWEKANADKMLGPQGLVTVLNNVPTNPYVYDGTGYKGEGMMQLGVSDWTDIPAIRKAIQPYGLDLKEEEREVDKFVFTEKDWKKPVQ